MITNENFNQGDLAFVFCNDSYLFDLNLKFLSHSTLTDVITFNYNVGRQINGDICISCDRVAENAIKYKTAFSEKLPGLWCTVSCIYVATMILQNRKRLK